MKDDFGFYGNGLDGYAHYKQAFDESQKSGGGFSGGSGGNHSNNDLTKFAIRMSVAGLIYLILLIIGKLS